jgi:hypothetical protein
MSEILVEAVTVLNSQNNKKAKISEDDSTESLNESREVNLEDKLVRCSGLLHAMLMNKIINK